MESPAAARRPPHLRVVGALAVAGLLAGVAVQRLTGLLEVPPTEEAPLVLEDGGEFPLGQSAGGYFDFGNVPENVVVHRRLLLRNATKSTLIVTAMRSTCPCAGATVMEPGIAPGGVRELDVWVRLGGERSRTNAGILLDFRQAAEGMRKRTVVIGLHATLGGAHPTEVAEPPDETGLED